MSYADMTNFQSQAEELMKEIETSIGSEIAGDIQAACQEYCVGGCACSERYPRLKEAIATALSKMADMAHEAGKAERLPTACQNATVDDCSIDHRHNESFNEAISESEERYKKWRGV